MGYYFYKNGGERKYNIELERYCRSCKDRYRLLSVIDSPFTKVIRGPAKNYSNNVISYSLVQVS